MLTGIQHFYFDQQGGRGFGATWDMNVDKTVDVVSRMTSPLGFSQHRSDS